MLTVSSHAASVQESFLQLDGTRPTRETFMKALASVDAILIRSTFYADMSTAILRALSMDTASPQSTSHSLATSVEHCSCPEGYVGLSCEVSCLEQLHVDCF